MSYAERMGSASILKSYIPNKDILERQGASLFFREHGDIEAV